jgi:ethanolamine utilization protein EutP (predicted NTPase)
LQAQTKGRGFIGSRPSVLIVNKIDLTGDFALTKHQLDAAGQMNWYIAQASAKSGYNVAEAFERLAKMMLEARKVSA